MRWRPIRGYEGLYEVSDTGKVRSLDRRVGHRLGGTCFRKGAPMATVWLAGNERRKGYEAVGLCKNGTQRFVKIHHAVLEAFVAVKPTPHSVGRHRDGDTTNNHYKNLAWGTYQDNSNDMKRHGTVRKGSSHPLAKLNDAMVKRIRQRLKKETAASIARDLGMSNQQISNIKLRKSWSHIE